MEKQPDPRRDRTTPEGRWQQILERLDLSDGLEPETTTESNDETTPQEPDS